MNGYLYILFSQVVDRYYIGSTINVSKRLRQHNNGMNKSTKFGIPWDLVKTFEFPTEQLSKKAEYILKKKKSRKITEWVIRCENFPFEVEK